MPLISFIIPYYNEPADLVEHCVRSIADVALPDEDKEVIVVADGAETDLEAPLSRICPHLIYIRQDNGGLSRARNAGLARATGRYVQFVDADDCLLPDAYTHVAGTLRATAPDIVQFRFATAPDARPTVEADLRPTFTGSGTDLIHHHNLRAAAWSYAYRRELAEGLTFQPGLLHEDELFTPQLFLRAENLLTLPLPAYCYRQRSGSITSNLDKDHIVRRLNDKTHIVMRLDEVAADLPPHKGEALRRRIAQLCADLLVDTARLTGSAPRINETGRVLRCLGLFPLPLKRYGARYVTMALLSHLLPLRRAFGETILRIV